MIFNLGRIRNHTKSLLHFDGADGSTTFVDETGKIWTGNSYAKIYTGYVKFGTASLYPGYGITTPSSSDFAFLTENFTIDFWAYFTPNYYTVGIYLDKTNTIGKHGIWYYMNGNRCILHYNGSEIYNSGDNAFSLSDWAHIALVGTGSAIKIYLNGVLFHSVTVNYNIPTNDAAIFGTNYNATCPVDEFRISNFARWTTDFTPPATAYVLD